MTENMVSRTAEILKNEIHETMRMTEDYIANDIVKIPKWLVSESEV